MRGEDLCRFAESESQEIHIYHICTKGLEKGLLFHDAGDYRRAVNLLAIISCAEGISVVAYCLMTNHIHVVVGASYMIAAEKLGMTFKKEYSQYYTHRYGNSKIFRSVVLTVKELSDLYYVRNCIAYVLRNPLDGGLVKAAEKYEWSSMGCYFANEANPTGIPLSQMSIRAIRGAFCTRRSIKGCGRLSYDGMNGIVPRSFVEYGFVESLFNDSVVGLCAAVSRVNSAQMEYELAVSSRIRYNDYELVERVDTVIKKWFGLDRVRKLDMRQKSKVAGYMYRYCNAGVAQVSRILGLDRSFVSEILGREDSAKI